MTNVIERQTPYGLRVASPGGFEDVVERVRGALAAEGFGVLTEIDVQATLKNKLDVDVPPYLILGACNPPLAHRALQADPEIGLLLPCNVVVFREGDATTVAAIDPVAQLGVAENAALEPIAEEVRERLERVLAGVAA